MAWEKTKPPTMFYISIGDIYEDPNTGKSRPIPLDHIRVSGGTELYKEIFTQVYGEKPTSIVVLFTEDFNGATKYLYERWLGGRMVCQGNAVEAEKFIYIDAPRKGGGTMKVFSGREKQPCLGEKCEHAIGEKPTCFKTASLTFMLPQAAGFGLAGDVSLSTRGEIAIDTLLSSLLKYEQLYHGLSGIMFRLSCQKVNGAHTYSTWLITPHLTREQVMMLYRTAVASEDIKVNQNQITDTTSAMTKMPALEDKVNQRHEEEVWQDDAYVNGMEEPETIQEPITERDYTLDDEQDNPFLNQPPDDSFKNMVAPKMIGENIQDTETKYRPRLTPEELLVLEESITKERTNKLIEFCSKDKNLYGVPIAVYKRIRQVREIIASLIKRDGQTKMKPFIYLTPAQAKDIFEIISQGKFNVESLVKKAFEGNQYFEKTEAYFNKSAERTATDIEILFSLSSFEAHKLISFVKDIRGE